MSEAALSDKLLGKLSAHIAAQMGLHFPPSRWPELARWLSAIAAEFGFKQATECAQWLASSRFTKDQIEKIASCLTVGETYFFRESSSFNFLKDKILPKLINDCRALKKELVIWSAGC